MAIFHQLTPKAIWILAGAGMFFEGKNTRLQDVPWYVWLFYAVGIVVFFVLLLEQVWWYFGAANVFFLSGSYLLHKTGKRDRRFGECNGDVSTVISYQRPRLISHGCGMAKVISSRPSMAMFFRKLTISPCFACWS
jgi:hypothetical protein